MTEYEKLKDSEKLVVLGNTVRYLGDDIEHVKTKVDQMRFELNEFKLTFTGSKDYGTKPVVERIFDAIENITNNLPCKENTRKINEMSNHLSRINGYKNNINNSKASMIKNMFMCYVGLQTKDKLIVGVFALCIIGIIIIFGGALFP